MAVAVAAGLASCSAPTPQAKLETEVDSLSYAIGLARTQGLDQYLMQQGIDSAQVVTFLKGFKEGAAMESKGDLAYINGLQIGYMVANQWVEGFTQQVFGNDSTQTLDRENMLAGFLDGVTGTENVMKQSVADIYMRRKMAEVKDKALAVQFADNKEAGEKFLAENKTKEGVQVTPSGLQYKVIKQGNGAVPADTSKVKVNYKGMLIDGTEFDSSYKRKDKNGKTKPATLRANQVIKGWKEALTMMPVGSKWELYIPYDLAYGSQNRPPHIKPYSALVFEVELVGIDK